MGSFNTPESNLPMSPADGRNCVSEDQPDSETRSFTSFSTFVDIWSAHSHTRALHHDCRLLHYPRKLLTTFTLKYVSALFFLKKTQWTKWIWSLWGWSAAMFPLVFPIAFSPFPFSCLHHLSENKPSLTFKPAQVSQTEARQQNRSKTLELRRGFFQV